MVEGKNAETHDTFGHQNLYSLTKGNKMNLSDISELHDFEKSNFNSFP